MRRGLSGLVLTVWIAISLAQTEPVPPAHFHHVHLNVVDPAAAIAFYASKFDCEKAEAPDGNAGIRAQRSWLLFNKVATPAPSEILSGIWHIGWGAEDMPVEYTKQLTMGTRFETPLTDISDLVGMSKGKFFYAYVDGPGHELIELNTASNHHFGHLHLLSADPIAAAEWYREHLGLRIVSRQTEKRMYRGVQVAPSASLQADDVRIIIFPVEYARGLWPGAWQSRQGFEPTEGRVIDHIAFTREGARNEFVEGPDRVRIELLAGK